MIRPVSNAPTAVPEMWIVFDNETTDLVGHDLLSLSQQPHCIEFAALLGSLDQDGNAEEIDTLDFLCHPGFEITELTTRLTGITAEMLKGKPAFGHYARQMHDLFAIASHRAAHNLTFDERILDFENERLGYLKGHPLNWRGEKRQRRVCTVEMTEHLHGRRLKLSELYQEMTGKPHEGAHRALVDVRATWACIIELRKRGVL